MGDYVHVRQVPLEAISGYTIPLKLESCGCKSPDMDAGNQTPALWKGHRLEDEIRKQYLFSASKKNTPHHQRQIPPWGKRTEKGILSMRN